MLYCSNLIEGVKRLELPFEKTVCRYWKQKLYQLHTQEETQELRIPEGMPDVGRVISAWGQIVLRGKEWRERGVGANGGVMVWVLYQPEDGGDLQQLESWVPFQTRMDMPPSEEDGSIRVQCVLRSADARITSSRKLMLRCGIGLLVQVLVPAEAELYTPGELPENLEVLRSSYPMLLTREAGEKQFMLDEELELPGAVSSIDRLVYFQLEPELLDQKVLGSRAAFRGVGNLHVLYWNQDGKLCTYDFQVPFAQYAELEGEYGQEARISNLFCVTSLELDLEESGTLHLRCGMVSQYTVQDRSVFDLVEDAYCPCADVEMTYQTLTLPAQLDSRQQTVDLCQTIPGGDDQLVDRWVQADLPQVERQGEQTKVRVDGFFGALMESRDGTWSAQSAKGTADMSQKSGCTTDTVCFSWRKGSVGCRREGSDWRVDTQLVLDLSTVSTQSMNVVTSLKIGAERAPDPERCSVIIRAKGEDERLWDLAKRCGSTVSAIERLNKLEGEPDAEQLLLIPVI